HGMFQFYGANRSGRWAGRLIQLQNLPQNHMEDLEQARDLVKAGDYEMLDMLYDSVPGVLSELIRTAFIPRPGYKFIVSDFSAIEARVLAYLAGEQWVLDVFNNGGDIYCETASRMFGVTVEKHGQNAAG
uniref:DNA polymerase n=1 Tax=uncultured Ruminobacter sp. TaxID=538947 RepID=UPI0025EA4E2E